MTTSSQSSSTPRIELYSSYRAIHIALLLISSSTIELPFDHIRSCTKLYYRVTHEATDSVSSKMVSFVASDIPALLIENEGLNGFYFITIPSTQHRTYRITMERSNELRYYDFLLNTAVLASHPDLWNDLVQLDGAVIIGIPFNRSSFKSYDLEPSPPVSIVLTSYKTMAQASADSIGPNTFSGETLKLTMIEPEKASVNLVEINKDYYMGDAMIVRFIYYRMIGNELVFTGSFGDPMNPLSTAAGSPLDIATNTPIDSLRALIDTTKRIMVINQSNRRYYIFRVTNTPNVIFTPLQHESDVSQDVEYYTKNGLDYRLTLPGNIYVAVPYVVYLNAYSNGVLVDPPVSVHVNADAMTQVLLAEIIEQTRTLKLTLRTTTVAETMNLYVYA